MKRRILISVALGIVGLIFIVTFPVGDWIDYSRGWYRGMQGEEKYIRVPGDTPRFEEIGWEAGATFFHGVERRTAEDLGLDVGKDAKFRDIPAGCP